MRAHTGGAIFGRHRRATPKTCSEGAHTGDAPSFVMSSGSTRTRVGKHCNKPWAITGVSRGHEAYPPSPAGRKRPTSRTGSHPDSGPHPDQGARPQPDSGPHPDMYTGCQNQRAPGPGIHGIDPLTCGASRTLSTAKSRGLATRTGGAEGIMLSVSAHAGGALPGRHRQDAPKTCSEGAHTGGAPSTRAVTRPPPAPAGW